VRVQQPLGASGLTGDPALNSLGVAADSFHYFERDFGALAAGGRIALSVSYTKPTGQLSVETLGQTLPAGVVSDSASAASTNPNLPWIIGGSALGLGLTALGVLAYRRRQRPLARRGRGPATGKAGRVPGRPAVIRRRHAGARRQPPTRPDQAVARLAGNARASRGRPATKPEPVIAAPAGIPGSLAYCTQCGHRLQPGDRFCRQCGARVSAP
jgi:hypothetical protein